MSEDGNIFQQLSLVLSELKEQRKIVIELQEEVRGSNQSALKEVKKLINEKEITWKFKGNKVQFEFNEDIAEILKTVCSSVENKNYDHCLEVANEGFEKLKKRNIHNSFPSFEML